MGDLSSNGNLAETKPAGGATAAGGDKQDKAEAQDFRKNFNYPLVRVCDMNEEMRTEAVDLVVTAIERHQGNYEAAAKIVKETMDKKAGTTWHVVIGEGFGYEITHEVKNLLFMYFGGNLGVLVYKQA